MKKSHLIALAIFTVTYLGPFRFAVLDVDADAHGWSTFGVAFTGIGAMLGIYFLIKDDKEKEGHGENAHH